MAGMGGLHRSQRGGSLINPGSSEKVEGQVKGRFVKAREKREGSKEVGVQETARAVVAESNRKQNRALV